MSVLIEAQGQGDASTPKSLMGMKGGAVEEEETRTYRYKSFMARDYFMINARQVREDPRPGLPGRLQRAVAAGDVRAGGDVGRARAGAQAVRDAAGAAQVSATC